MELSPPQLPQVRLYRADELSGSGQGRQDGDAPEERPGETLPCYFLGDGKGKNSISGIGMCVCAILCHSF